MPYATRGRMAGAFGKGSISPLTACLLLVCACTNGPPAAPGLELREQAIVELPRDLRVAGGTLVPGGDVILWSDNAPALVRLSPNGHSRQIEYAANYAPLTVAFDAARGVLQIFSRVVRRVVSIDTSGRLLGEFVLSHALDSSYIYSAAFAEGRLAIAVGQPRGESIAILQVDSLGVSDTLRIIPIPKDDENLPDSTAHTEVVLGLAGSRLCTTHFWEPHTSYCTQGRMSRGLALQPSGLEYRRFLEKLGPQQRAAVAITPVEVSTGFLQVIADLRSSKRLLLRYDHAGVMQGATLLNDVFGLVAADPEERSVIALRDVGVTELVWYRY